MLKKGILVICVLGTFATAQGKEVKDHETDSEWKAISAKPFTNGESVFHGVMDKLLAEYVDRGLTKDELYHAATAGMLGSLNSDEHIWNRLLSPEDMEEMQITMSGKVSGIGVNIKWMDPQGYGQVLNTIAGSPAAKAGVQKDDMIVAVDGKSFKGHTFREMVEATRGKTGETVTLKILRGDRLSNFQIKRETIPWAPAVYEPLGNKTGMIALHYFTEQAADVTRLALEQANHDGVKKLILDLRDNSGGSFEAAVKIAGLFLPDGSPVVRVESRTGDIKTFKSSGGGIKPDVEVVVLTNQRTASGAELVAMALRESRQARLIGMPTLGKWNIQSVEELPNHFAVKFTVQRFQSPLGHSYQDKGVEPDIRVELPEGVDFHELEARKEPAVRLEKDTQLKTALGLLHLT